MVDVKRTDRSSRVGAAGEAPRRWSLPALALVVGLAAIVVALAAYGAVTLIGQIRAGTLGGKAEVGTSVGAVAPDITVYDLDGNAVTLYSFRGKTVLLNFRATWCHYCQAEAPALQQTFQDDEDLAIVSVYIGEDAATVTQFAQSNGYTFPMYTDTGEASAAYQVQGIPASFFIDAKGRIFATALGSLTSDSIRSYLAEE